MMRRAAPDIEIAAWRFRVVGMADGKSPPCCSTSAPSHDGPRCQVPSLRQRNDLISVAQCDSRYRASQLALEGRSWSASSPLPRFSHGQRWQTPMRSLAISQPKGKWPLNDVSGRRCEPVCQLAGTSPIDVVTIRARSQPRRASSKEGGRKLTEPVPVMRRPLDHQFHADHRQDNHQEIKK